jgi:hypothetical protein
VDFVARDAFVGHLKYYYLQGQFDVQVLASGDFVENNGRGSIATGWCEKAIDGSCNFADALSVGSASSLLV